MYKNSLFDEKLTFAARSPMQFAHPARPAALHTSNHRGDPYIKSISLIVSKAHDMRVTRLGNTGTCESCALAAQPYQRRTNVQYVPHDGPR